MRVIPPLPITESILLSSSLADVAPLYVAGTTYALGENVTVGAVGTALTVYRSLQAGNVGHAPDSSPAWWVATGTAYSVYSSAVTYGLGARVLDPVAHLVYESQMAGNVGHPLTLGTAWLKVGPSNLWAPFDQLRNTQAVSPVDIVYTLAPGVRTSSIAVIGLDASSVTITVSSAGVEVYAVTAILSTRKTFGWKDYFFGEFKYRKAIQFFNLPPYRNAVITVTVSKQKGRRAVGGIIIGNAVYLGRTLASITSDHLNFSPVERDEFGNAELHPVRSVPKVNEQVVFDKKITSRILEVRELLNGAPAVWSALDDFRSDNFEPTFIYGVHKEFSLNLEPTTHGIITLEVEEI